MSDPANRTVSDWLADLEISEAEVDAGILVPGETVLAEIQAAIESDPTAGLPAPIPGLHGRGARG